MLYMLSRELHLPNVVSFELLGILVAYYVEG